MQPEIRLIDPHDDADVEATYQVQLAAEAQDVPDFPHTRMGHFGRHRHPWPGYEPYTWLATVDGEPAGVLPLALPVLDNTHVAEADVIVHPAFRRQGLGRTLFAHAVDFARQKGRRLLQGEHHLGYVGQEPAGHAAFADAVGAKPALPEARRRLDLETVDRSVWAELRADALTRSEGYSLVRWTDRAPDEIVAGLALLNSRFLADTPLGDLDLEPENFDISRVRAQEEVGRLRQRRTYHVGARHDATGEFAAWTTIAYDGDVQTHAWQMVTMADRAHRGHRLGMLVKLENLDHVLGQEPATRYINTWNASENSHMIAINEAMGFRIVDEWVSWQMEV